MADAKAIAKSKRDHDESRQSRAVLVRLSEEEAEGADECMTSEDSTRAALLRRLLRKEIARVRRTQSRSHNA